MARACFFIAFFSFVMLARFAYANEEFVLPDVYQVEMVLFKHNRPELDVLQYEHVSSRYSRPKPYAVLYPYNDKAPGTRSRPLLSEDADRTLDTAVRRLRNSSDFEVLFSASWNETLENDSEGLPVIIETPTIKEAVMVGGIKLELDSERAANGSERSASATLPVSKERFVGHVQIKRSRYLHADVRIDYEFLKAYHYQNIRDWFLSNEFQRRHFAEIVYPLNRENLAETFDDFASGDLALSYHPTRIYSLAQSRRIKDEEIQYIDHPFLGLIISIKKLEQELY